jgi:uncharacterized membrane protein
VLAPAFLFVHLVAFAAYLGAGFAQTNLMKASAKTDISAEVRAAYERLVAGIITKIELPAIFGAILSGIVYVAANSAVMKQGWLHGKLAVVLVLAVLSHVEMFNARTIVREREGGGVGAEADIAARKKRHAALGSVGAVLVVVLLILVTFVRLRAV